MIRGLFSFSLAIMAAISHAQGILDTVPDSLQENANEIVIYDRTEFEILDIANSRESHEYQAIIVNKEASDRNIVHLSYDDFTTIKTARVTVTNLEGKELEDFKLKDFEDYSAKGSSLASDNRSKYLKVVSKPPYVVSVSYEYLHSGSLFYPTWVPQSDENQSIVSASLKIISDKNTFRYKGFGVAEPQQLENGIYEWKVTNLKPFEYQRYSPHFYAYAPIVYTAPNDFMMDNIAGNMSTWKNLGKWLYELMKDRNTLTEEELAEVKTMIPDEATDLDKIRLIYEYVQNSTRYVSIQLGIGGWKPFDSQFVHKKKYGDCKALSFYTKSLLEAIGIPAYYTIINAGPSKREPFEDFPASVFNHVIVTVPMPNDTIWLECTSQTNQFGYLGTFTSDRKALMVTAEGGQLIHTKSYSVDENIQSTTTTIDVQEDGSASVSLHREYSGLEIGNNRFSSAILKPEEEQLEWFYDRHNWGAAKVQELELTKPHSAPIPTGEMKVKVDIAHYASNNANRLFVSPFTFTSIKWMTLKSKERAIDLVIRYPFTQKDTILLILPEKYAPENLPKATSISNDFGHYQLKVSPSAEGIELIREFQLFQGSYTPEEYGDFRKFIKSVQKSDRQKLVMVDKT